MHGLEQQTIESINLLKARKTPFIIALNKIDRLYGWKTHANAPFPVTIAQQSDSTRGEFDKRAQDAILLMAQQGLNVELYYKNTDFRKNISVVPTSAHTGEGSATHSSTHCHPLSLSFPFSRCPDDHL